MLTGAYKDFCKDYDKVEGYERALRSDEPYFIHHKQGIYASREELKELGWYYDCAPDCLMWVTKSEHDAIHRANIRLDTRRKISEARKGRTHSAETRQKISDAHKGKTHSAETRKKMAESMKGKNLGKTRSEETRRKLSEASKGRTSPNKGRTFSEETRKKISEAAKAAWKIRKL